MEYLKTGEVAERLNISFTTVKRWIYRGKIRAVKTVAGQWRVPESEVDRLLGVERQRTVRAVGYARVSSHEQRDDLGRQKEEIAKYAKARGYKLLTVLDDVASGLSERRRGLDRLFEMTEKGVIDVVVVTYRDRLTRFGFKHFERYFSSHGVRIEVVDGVVEGEAGKRELVEDLIAIVSSFAGRLYGMRSHKRKKVIECVEEAVKDG